ncbi:MAG: hypothetical protein JJT82_07775 [Legionellaceae bacterium]|nr:hypothetical protein [Legionellaceae bacterium]
MNELVETITKQAQLTASVFLPKSKFGGMLELPQYATLYQYEAEALKTLSNMISAPLTLTAIAGACAVVGAAVASLGVMLLALSPVSVTAALVGRAAMSAEEETGSKHSTREKALNITKNALAGAGFMLAGSIIVAVATAVISALAMVLAALSLVAAVLSIAAYAGEQLVRNTLTAAKPIVSFFSKAFTKAKDSLEPDSEEMNILHSENLGSNEQPTPGT